MWSQCNLDTATAWAVSESLVKFLWDEDYIRILKVMLEKTALIVLLLFQGE